MIGILSFNLIVAVCGMTLSVVGLIQLFHGIYLDRKNLVFFTAFFGITFGYALCILTRSIVSDRTEYVWAQVSRCVMFGQSFFSSLLTVMIIGFLLYQCGETSFTRNPFFRLAAALWLGYILLLVYSQFTGIVYSIDNQNGYRRGPYFAAQMILPLLIMAIYLFLLWKNRGKLSKKQKRAFLFYVIIPLPCILIQMFFFGIHFIFLGTVIAMLFMYVNIVSDQMERYFIKEKENAALKIDILLAQIQPHFLFNSLTTIRHLCRTNPDRAAEAIDDFTTYLRHNMDSLSIDKPIPFEEELAHVRVYLALQKLRFGNELNVVYDLKCTDFSIPTLTVQPLVENAVTYGVRKNKNGTGTVTIRTRNYFDRVEVTVEDDGPGFVSETAPEDPLHSHIGIRNVRERLDQISGGELQIDSAPGKGCRATIILNWEDCGKDTTGSKRFERKET